MIEIRKPAFSGTLPSSISWKLPSKEELLILQKYFDYFESIEKKDGSSDEFLLGYYRLIGKDNFFLKIIDSSEHNSQLDASLVSSWLSDSGISVSRIKSNYPVLIKEHNLWIYLYGYVDHNFFDGSNESIFLVGESLGKMHKIMKTSPFIDKAFDLGTKKNKILSQQFKKICQDDSFSLFPSRAIQLIANTSLNEFSSITSNSQMIHGDMNFGNIIFKKGDNKPIFIDFEDSISSWLSPLYDIAFVIQRFVLQEEKSNKLDLAKNLLNGYLSQNELTSLISTGSFYNTIKMISIRSLLLLSTLSNNEQKLFKGEINKFINLYSETENNKSLIFEIEQYTLSK